MPTPRGCLQVITTALKRLARNGDVEGLRAYIRSNFFLADFAGLEPERRQSALRAYARAETLCEAKAPHRLDQAQTHRCQAGAEGELERSGAPRQVG